MTQRPDDLELIVLDLIEPLLAAQVEIFIFASGELRGRLKTATYLPRAVAASTFLRGKPTDPKPEACISLVYIPRQKDPKAKTKFTRKPVIFNVPVELVPDVIFLQKLDDKKWMINMNTSTKR